MLWRFPICLPVSRLKQGSASAVKHASYQANVKSSYVSYQSYTSFPYVSMCYVDHIELSYC